MHNLYLKVPSSNGLGTKILKCEGGNVLTQDPLRKIGNGAPNLTAKAVALNPPKLAGIETFQNKQNAKTLGMSKAAQIKDKALGAFGKPNVTSLATGAADFVAAGLNAHSKVVTNDTQQAAKKAILTGISMIPVYGQAIAAAAKVADAIGNATGTNLDAMDKTQAKEAGISKFGRIMNNVAGALPGTFLGAFTGDTNDAYNTREAMELTDAFGGATSTIGTASGMGGRSYLFGKRKANALIDKSNNYVDILTNLNRTNAIRKKADTESFAMRNESMYNGSSMASDRTYVGKNGMKLMTAEETRQIILNKKGGSMNEENSELQSLVALMAGFAKGDSNTITGAEHAFDEAQHKNGYTYDERVNDIALRTINDPAQEILLMCKSYGPVIQNKLKNSPEGLQAFEQMLQNFNPETVYTAASYLNESLGNKLQLFQNGGVIGIDTNILPEGALHKDLNHLEDINPEIGEEVTTKGIPVIVTDENSNVEQVAEIEREEIIFRKEITTKLEELWKDGSEEAMIEAGKLIAEEIITNTQDNTGQLENEDSSNNN